MRGSPPIHLAFVLLLFIGLAVPLVRLTHGEPVTQLAVVIRAQDRTVPTLVRVRCAHQPSALKLTQGNVVLMEGSPAERSVGIAMSPAGIELNLEAKWPVGTPETAVTVELEPDGLDSCSETRWSSGESLSEILTFIWKS